MRWQKKKDGREREASLISRTTPVRTRNPASLPVPGIPVRHNLSTAGRPGNCRRRLIRAPSNQGSHEPKVPPRLPHPRRGVEDVLSDVEVTVAAFASGAQILNAGLGIIIYHNLP